MMGFSASVELENEFSDRFWFWRGASRKRYIHSVYTAGNCPPLPGAIYVVVRKLEGGSRLPLRIGRFSQLWDFPTPDGVMDAECEIHVHLLAGNEMESTRIFDDLKAGLGLGETRDTATLTRADQSAASGGLAEPALPLFAGFAA